jgi:hypothetical protein
MLKFKFKSYEFTVETKDTLKVTQIKIVKIHKKILKVIDFVLYFTKCHDFSPFFELLTMHMLRGCVRVAR